MTYFIIYVSLTTLEQACSSRIHRISLNLASSCIVVSYAFGMIVYFSQFKHVVQFDRWDWRMKWMAAYYFAIVVGGFVGMAVDERCEWVEK